MQPPKSLNKSADGHLYIYLRRTLHTPIEAIYLITLFTPHIIMDFNKDMCTLRFSILL